MTASNLHNLVVFNDTARQATSELLDYNFDLFNTASEGCIVLGAGDQAEFAIKSFWSNFAGISYRNPYIDDAIGEITPSMLEDVSVKSAWTTGTIRFDPAQFDWLLINPQEAAGQWAIQFAQKQTEFLVNAAVTSLIAALLNDRATNLKDVTGETSKTASSLYLRQTAGKMGDKQTDIRTWILHSKVMGDLWDAALTNANLLFNYGNVNIYQDAFGRRFIITDNEHLVIDDTTDSYYTLGLKPGAAMVRRGSRVNDNWQTTNGRTNITRTYQQEGDFNVSVAGYAWDMSHGGRCPNLSGLGVSTNWDKYVTSHKHLPGVILLSQ